MNPGTDKHLLEVKLLLRPDEAADILRVSRRVIYHMCEDGTLEAIKVRGSLRVKSESVRRHLNAKP